MKKISLILIISLSAITSFAQFPNTQTLGNSKTLVKANGGLGSDSGFVYTKNFPDTIEANGGFLKNIAGITIRVGDTLYMRANCLCEWKKIGSGGISVTDTALISQIATDSIAAQTFILGNGYLIRGDTADAVGITDSAYVKQVVSDTAMWLRNYADSVAAAGGGTPTLQQVTKLQADSLIAISALVKGSWYAISGVHATLYGGTTVILQAIETNKFGVAGHGVFYNPVYNRLNVCDTSVASRTTGDTAVWGGYVWVCNTTGKPIATDILNLDASWTKVAYDTFAYNISIDEINYDYYNDLIVMRHEVKADNIVSYVKSDIDFFGDNYGFAYNAIAVFMWGNPYNYFTSIGVGKNKIYNSYFETVSQIGSSIYSNTLTNSSIYSNTLINSYIYSNTLINSSIYSNTLINSYIYSNTLINSDINSSTLTAGSSINSNTLTNSGIYSNTLISSYIYSNTLTNSTIYPNTLTNSNINSNTLTAGSSINSNTLTNSDINNNTLTAGSYISIGLIYPIVSKMIRNVTINNASINVDISSATIIYLAVSKKVFTMPNGTVKISYINNDNVTVTADINY